MFIQRFELDVSTGVRSEIDQIAYRNEEGDVLVLDAIEPTPDGYEPFDPSGDIPE